jgi:hypothetical protein
MADSQLDAIRYEVVTLRRLRFEELGTSSIPIFAGDIENLGNYLDRFDVIFSCIWMDRRRKMSTISVIFT